ncbi:MAG: hypothetical protein HC831_18860, partial [Chloroflexia bacterium]|nr:hypothetical protein [Chloroflexia bacterium]
MQITSKLFHDESDLTSLAYNDVVAITEDTNKRLWIATNGGGLNLMNPDKES